MTDQTTYRQKIRNEKEEIDLVQMIQYVLQKWKILLLAGVVGLLLGGAFGAMKTGKEPAQMDIDDLNADQIQQYANYHQFYEDEVAREKESIYMNMDPGAVYMADKSDHVAAQESRSEPSRPCDQLDFASRTYTIRFGRNGADVQPAQPLGIDERHVCGNGKESHPA